jgi:hypothetical protein
MIAECIPSMDVNIFGAVNHVLSFGMLSSQLKSSCSVQSVLFVVSWVQP